MSKQRIHDQESRKRNKPQSLIPYAQKQDKEEKLFMMSDEMAAYHKSKQEKKDNRITGTEWFKRKMKPKPETETATTQETEEEQVEEVVQEQEITNTTNNGGSSSPSANSGETEEIDRSSLKGGLYDISKALGPAYDYKKLQKEWFPTGTDFSELWPNLIIEYYLKQVGWKTSDPAPYVKHTFIGGRLVILSTFAGKIGEGHIDSITAFNYIALKGLKGTAKAGFHLLNSESDFSSSAGTGVITGGRAIGYEFKPTEQDKINDQSEASFYQELSSDRDLLTSDLFSSEAISATHDQLAKDYYDYWDLYPQKLDRVEHSGTGTPIYRSAPESTIAKVEQKRIDLENKLKANGYQSIDEFGAFLAVISKRHQDATVRLANGILDNYEQKIKEKEEKFKDENYVQGLYNSLQGVIKLNRNKATVDNYNKMPTKTYSEYLAKDAHSQYIPQAEKNIEEITPQANAETENIRKNYPELDENDIEKLFPQLSVVRDLDDFKRVLKEYIKEKKDNIQTTRDRLVDDPGSVYKMDALLALSKDALGVKKDSTSDLVINRAQKRRVAEDRAEDMLLAMITIGLAITATIATAGGASPLVVALLASASLTVSIHDAMRTLDHYDDDDAANNLSFSSQDPNIVWVVVAFVGAGLDFIPFLDLLKTAKGFKLKGIINTFRKTGDATEFKKSVEVLDTAEGLGKTKDDLIDVTNRLADSRAAYKEALDQRYNKAVDNFMDHMMKHFTLRAVDNPFDESSIAKAFTDLLSVSLEKGLDKFSVFLKQLKASSPNVAKLLDENPSFVKQVEERFEEGIKNAENVKGSTKVGDEVGKGVSKAEVSTVEISDNSLKHADLGDFTTNPKTGKISKMKGGGHGQSNIEFLESNGIDYNIVKEYPNGVRIGNIPGHKSKPKRTGTGQSWFPESWTKQDIKNAGKYVSSLPDYAKAPDGWAAFGTYKDVRVGVIKTNGKLSTVFPDQIQP